MSYKNGSVICHIKMDLESVFPQQIKHLSYQKKHKHMRYQIVIKICHAQMEQVSPILNMLKRT